MDAETGKTIPCAGAGFQLYRPDGSLITQSFTYPTPTTIDAPKTGDDSKPWSWLTPMVISAVDTVALGIAGLKKRKKKDDE